MMRFFDMLRNERGAVGPKPDDNDDDDNDNKPDPKPEPDPALDDSFDDHDDGDDDGDGDIEIDLDEDDDDDQQKHPAARRLDQEKKKLKEDNERLAKQVAELQKKNAQPATPVPDTQPKGDPSDPMNWTEEQWDALAKRDWKKAVDLRAEIKARQQYEEQTKTQEFTRVLEDSKNQVLQRHPELGDEASEKSKIYRNIVTANPEYVNMKEGPLFAMYKMEEFMEKNMGYKREDIVKAEQKAREDEQGRLNRVSLTSTTGRTVSSDNKIILTKDEQDFCELQGLDPKVYATNKKKLATSGNKGGIQL
jgi:hypothetical protein